MKYFFFFFKQKAAYGVYQCDWSSDVCSSDLFERLLDETTLFLHQVESDFTGIKKKMTEKIHNVNILKDKTILLVDDDMRNVFALSSLLESYDMKVIVGKNRSEERRVGKECRSRSSPYH